MEPIRGYEAHEIFTLPWETVYTMQRTGLFGDDTAPLKYVALCLPKVSLEFRVYLKGDRYQTRCKYRDEPSWVLGQCRSLEESQWRVIDHLLYFRLYQTGTWSAERHVEFREMAKKD